MCQILKKPSEQKGLEIIESQLCPDYIHTMVSIPSNSNLSVAQSIGYQRKKIANNIL